MLRAPQSVRQTNTIITLLKASPKLIYFATENCCQLVLMPNVSLENAPSDWVVFDGNGDFLGEEKMNGYCKALWNDTAGFIVSVELILIATIAVIGLVAGLTAVRDGVTSELSDVAGSIQDLNQSYSYNGITGHSGSVAGSDFTDNLDFCDSTDDAVGEADNCITFDRAPENELGATGPGGF